MFRGSTNLNLDTKGRIAIPARFRAKLLDVCDGNLVITYNPLAGCLPIFPVGEWEEFERKMLSLIHI